MRSAMGTAVVAPPVRIQNLSAGFADRGVLRQLTLDVTGFSEGNLFDRTRHAWRDCSPFEVSAGSGRVQINSIRAATSAGEFRLRTRYGRSLDEVAALMNRFRVRALRVTDSDGSEIMHAGGRDSAGSFAGDGAPGSPGGIGQARRSVASYEGGPFAGTEDASGAGISSLATAVFRKRGDSARTASVTSVSEAVGAAAATATSPGLGGRNRATSGAALSRQTSSGSFAGGAGGEGDRAGGCVAESVADEIGEGALEVVQLLLVTAHGAEHLVAVLVEDGLPELGVAAGDAGGVAQAAAGVIAPRGIFLGEKRAEIRGDDLRQVADVGDDFVVLVGIDGHGLGAEVVPEFYDCGGGGGLGCAERGDEAGPADEEVGGAVFPAGFFGAGHRVGADKVGVRAEGGGAEAGDLAFDAADIGDESAGGKRRGDLAGERNDLIDGGGDDDESGAGGGSLGKSNPTLANG